MIIAAVDPSFSRTGIALLDTDNKKLIFNFVSPPGTNTDYASTVARSAIIISGILATVKQYPHVTLIYEEPLLTSMKASGLGVLSGIIAMGMTAIPQVNPIYTVRPSAVSQINSILASKNKSMTKKQISLQVVRSFIEYLEQQGFSIEYLTDKKNKDGSFKTRKLTHDEAEAFYILVFMLRHLEASKDLYIPQELKDKLYEINPGFRKVIIVNKLK
jgi:hypothetical protein